MSKKFDYPLNDAEFKSIVVNCLADLRAESVALRKIIFHFLAAKDNKSIEEIEACFKEEFESTRADILIKMLTR